MENFVVLLLISFSFTSLVYCQTTESLIILPQLTNLLKLQGDQLKLECVHKFTGSSDGVGTFHKGSQDHPIPAKNDQGYDISVKKQFVNGTTISTTTLIKNDTKSTDKGDYICTSNASETAQIKVYIFTVVGKNADLPAVVKGKDMKMLDLQCIVGEVPAEIDYNITWEYAGKQLEDDDRFNMFHNGTLQLLKPTRSDMGEYQCVVTFLPDSTVERHAVRPKPIILRAGPAIEDNSHSKNLVQGDNMELYCDVSGYPMPTMTWFKDGAELNTTTRIHTLDNNGVLGKLKIYSLEDTDKGIYECIAENVVSPFNASAKMTIGVKDKLAALWPFLGIVAEVIILCVIILCYEKRRSNKLEKEDAVDSNQDDAVDHKDVRHRRT